MDYLELEEIVRNNIVLLWGMGLIGHTWGYDVLKCAGSDIAGYSDNYGTISKTVSEPKLTIEEFTALGKNVPVFVAAREKNHKEIQAQLTGLGINITYFLGSKFIQNFYRSVDEAGQEIKKKYASIYDDELFLKRRFEYAMGKKLNLEKPVGFNEKLQWLKLHDRKPEYSELVDKYLAKRNVEKKIGEKYITKTYGLYDDLYEIQNDRLPSSFVVKCTHDSGTVYICHDKTELRNKNVRELFASALESNYFVESREWPYKHLKPRIIVEEYLDDGGLGGITDYKFFCFSGVVDNVMVVRDRKLGSPKYYHFSRDWKLLRYNRLGRSLSEDYEEKKPVFIDEMIEIAEYLSKDIDHVRIDLYEVCGQIYFGEYTFYSCGGYETGFDEMTDLHLGSLIKSI